MVFHHSNFLGHQTRARLHSNFLGQTRAPPPPRCRSGGPPRGAPSEPPGAAPLPPHPVPAEGHHTVPEVSPKGDTWGVSFGDLGGPSFCPTKPMAHSAS